MVAYQDKAVDAVATEQADKSWLQNLRGFVDNAEREMLQCEDVGPCLHDGGGTYDDGCLYDTLPNIVELRMLFEHGL